MGKGRSGFYSVKGDTFTRTHTFCPKCGPGVVLAIHRTPTARRSCGKCGYSEVEKAPVAAPPKTEKPARGPKGPRAEKASPAAST